MNKTYNIVGYKIIDVELHFENLKKEQSIGVETAVNLLIPKNKDDEKCYEFVSMVFQDEDSNIIFSAKLKGAVNISKKIENETKTEILKQDVLPKFYGNLKEYMEDIIKKSNLKFVDIPAFEDLDI